MIDRLSNIHINSLYMHETRLIDFCCTWLVNMLQQVNSFLRHFLFSPLDFFFLTQVMCHVPYFPLLHWPLTMHKHTSLFPRPSEPLVLDYWPLSKSSRHLDQGDQSNHWHRWNQEGLPNPVRRAWAQGLLLSGEGTVFDLKTVRLICSYSC